MNSFRGTTHSAANIRHKQNLIIHKIGITIHAVKQKSISCTVSVCSAIYIRLTQK